MRWLIGFLKRRIAGRELVALERYRLACQLAHQWNVRIPASRETARWINQVGEGERPTDIERLREQLRQWRA